MSTTPKEVSHKKEPDIVGFRTDNRTTQTRFHFRMDLCIGCHSCEVACQEQNGLPPDTQWRRVGEVEAGEFPETQRFYLSSACNHCLDAPCMKGCPVDAYQVNDRGAVVHLDDVCIGCQYCTWACPYGVPVFQKDRHIVTKCDLCSNRLDQGKQPACAQACPANAIEIEDVPLAHVIENHLEEGIAPDFVDPSLTIPSTKITLPKGMDPEKFKKVDHEHVKPEDPHTPLIWMTVLTQLSIGAFMAIFFLDLFYYVFKLPGMHGAILGWLSPVLIGIAGLALTASTLHLGRMTFAYRALKNWRTSWLSREVLALSLFAGVATGYAGILFTMETLSLSHIGPISLIPLRYLMGAITLVSGSLGIYASSKIYRVPARPAWNSRRTTFRFFYTAFLLGPLVLLCAMAVDSYIFSANAVLLKRYIIVSAVATFLLSLCMAGYLSFIERKHSESDEFELKSSAKLYFSWFSNYRFTRNVCLTAGLISLLFIILNQVPMNSLKLVLFSSFAFCSLMTYSLMNRYLFFVTVVPRNMAGNFLIAAHDQAVKKRKQ